MLKIGRKCPDGQAKCSKTLDSGTNPSSPPSAASFRPLGKDFSELRVVFVLVDVMNAYVSLQVVRSRVFMVSLGAKWANVAWRIVYEAVSNHLVLTLESFAAFSPRTPWNWAIVRPCLRMDVCVGIEQVLRLEGWCIATRVIALEPSTAMWRHMLYLRGRIWMCDAIDAHSMRIAPGPRWRAVSIRAPRSVALICRRGGKRQGWRKRRGIAGVGEGGWPAAAAEQLVA